MRILVSTVAAALSLAAFSVGPVTAAPSATDKTVHIVGEERFSPDEFLHRHVPLHAAPNPRTSRRQHHLGQPDQ